MSDPYWDQTHWQVGDYEDKLTALLHNNWNDNLDFRSTMCVDMAKQCPRPKAKASADSAEKEAQEAVAEPKAELWTEAQTCNMLVPPFRQK